MTTKELTLEEYLADRERDEELDEFDDLFAAFFSGAISERKFHATLKTFGYDQDGIDEMRDMWLTDRQRHQSGPLFARATEILNQLPLEDRKDLRDILRRLIAELPRDAIDTLVQIAFYDSAGGTMPDEVPARQARLLEIMQQFKLDEASRRWRRK